MLCLSAFGLLIACMHNQPISSRLTYLIFCMIWYLCGTYIILYYLRYLRVLALLALLALLLILALLAQVAQVAQVEFDL